MRCRSCGRNCPCAVQNLPVSPSSSRSCCPHSARRRKTRPIVDRLAKEIAAIVADPDFAEKQLKGRSLVGAADTPDQFAKLIVEDRKVAEGVVKAAGMEPE